MTPTRALLNADAQRIIKGKAPIYFSADDVVDYNAEGSDAVIRRSAALALKSFVADDWTDDIIRAHRIIMGISRWDEAHFADAQATLISIRDGERKQHDPMSSGKE